MEISGTWTFPSRYSSISFFFFFISFFLGGGGGRGGEGGWGKKNLHEYKESIVFNDQVLGFMGHLTLGRGSELDQREEDNCFTDTTRIPDAFSLHENA